MPIEYFGMIISSNAKKEKYNIKVNKDKENNLYKNSIVKSDHIYKLNKNDILKKVLLDDYVNSEKNLLDLEYDFIEKISKIRKEKEISPSLNTILKIINALNLSLNVVEKESHKWYNIWSLEAL